MATAHPKSAKLLELIQASPDGLQLADIVAKAGISRSLASYHLNTLQNKKLVKNNKKTQRWVAVGAAPAAPALPMLLPGVAPKGMSRVRTGITDAILERLQSGPVKRWDLASLGEGGSKYSIDSGLTRLRLAGKIVRTDDGWALADASHNAAPTRGPLKGVMRPGSIAERVVELLRDATNALQIGQIAASLGVHPTSARSAVDRLRENNVIVSDGARMGWRLGSGAPSQAAKLKAGRRTQELLPPAPLAHRAQQRPMQSVGPNGFSARQVQAIILRMQNANEYAEFFTPLDFGTLEKLLEGAR